MMSSWRDVKNVVLPSTSDSDVAKHHTIAWQAKYITGLRRYRQSYYGMKTDIIIL